MIMKTIRYRRCTVCFRCFRMCCNTDICCSAACWREQLARERDHYRVEALVRAAHDDRVIEKECTRPADRQPGDDVGEFP